MVDKQVILKKINYSHTNLVLKWRNSIEVKSQLFNQENITEEDHLRWINSYVNSGLAFQYIISTYDGSDIGTVFLKNIDIANKKAELGIFIGESEFRGIGYGKLAVNQVLMIGFNDLNLNKIYLKVFSDNLNAISSYVKSGFSVDGIMREDIKVKNEYKNVTIMSVTRSDWVFKNC